ncbi:hypothetical protein HPB50_020390 [Hyalomma asiaticum]|uniref:Uncharacterized protein n=1 Tax=Hyalomma asiaticum TaxID=266040 RepID=A0ACB7RKQ4_HYAAI|nr:hypothetical protein HPB50_020390 [Hyalomma asiaticum]
MWRERSSAHRARRGDYTHRRFAAGALAGVSPISRLPVQWYASRTRQIGRTRGTRDRGGVLFYPTATSGNESKENTHAHTSRGDELDARTHGRGSSSMSDAGTLG